MRIHGSLLWIALMMISCTACLPQPDSSTLSSLKVSPRITVVDQRKYEVHQRLDLVNEGPALPEKQNIWVALIRDFPPYQDVLSMDVSPGEYRLITDEYGNQYAEFDFSNHPVGTTEEIRIDYQIAVNELVYDLSTCVGDVLDEFTQPELHIESANRQIVTLAAELSRDKDTVCDQIRAFYNYAGDELVYTYNGRNWGAQATLGEMGADCTEYSSLLVALSRAQQIPARYFEGLLYLDTETQTKARIEHAWPDVYMPGVGWVAMDPTLGRALGDRDRYFGHYTPEHIIVTMGVNPSTLRGGSYWTHIYWPGNRAEIRVYNGGWEIKLLE